MTRRRALALAALAVLVGWFGYRRLGDASSEQRRADARAAARAARDPGGPGQRPRRGRFARDSAELGRVMRDLASRPDGLIRIAGTVRDDDSDRPVPGAEVVFASSAGEATATADDEGRYRIHLAPGAYRPFARADGFVAVGAAPPPRIPGRPEAAEA